MSLAAFNFAVLDDEGVPVSSVEIEVLVESTGFPPALLYSDREGVTPLANPFTADGAGVLFYAPGGAYKIIATDLVTGGQRTWRHQGVGTAQEFDVSSLIESTARAPRIVTAAGTITVDPVDALLIVQKTVGAATTVNLHEAAEREDYLPLVVKDGKGDAQTNNITINAFAGETIDGQASVILKSNFASLGLRPVHGVGWVRT